MDSDVEISNAINDKRLPFAQISRGDERQTVVPSVPRENNRYNSRPSAGSSDRESKLPFQASTGTETTFELFHPKPKSVNCRDFSVVLHCAPLHV
jgi:hypothetical protein